MSSTVAPFFAQWLGRFPNAVSGHTISRCLRAALNTRGGLRNCAKDESGSRVSSANRSKNKSRFFPFIELLGRGIPLHASHWSISILLRDATS